VDEKLLTFGKVLVFSGFFALLGAAFGALVGYLAWKRGQAAGSVAGLSLARAIERASGRQSTPGQTGALVGAIDGTLFLGTIGTVVGLIAARGHVSWFLLSRVAYGMFLLTGGAVFFGGIAVGIIYGGSRSLAGVFAGGVVGGLSGALVARGDGFLIGAIGGVAAGTLLGIFRRADR
jgi:hypothetical protein